MNYFNVLGFFTLNDEFYGLTSTLYTLLGKLYKFLVGLAQNTDFISGSTEEFTRTIYVLAGVFMLFRIAVSFLNTLIDPDKLTDKNEGAGNILKRLVIVVLLMVALVPNSYVYKFLDRLQTAIIGEDGLITNMSKTSNMTVGSAVNKYINDINPFDGSYKNVMARGGLNGDNDSSTTSGQTAICYFYKEGSLEKSYKVTFFKLNPGSSGPGDPYVYVGGLNNLMYAKFDTGTDKISGASIKYVNYTGKVALNNYTSTVSKGKKHCPTVMKISGGTMTFYENASDCTDCDYSGNTFYTKDDNNSEVIKSDQGYVFSNNLLGSLTSCSEDSSSENCISMKEKLLADDDASIDYLDDDLLSISWLMAIIIGVVVFVYILILCIEVVVRSLKLILLQMIAPIAIMSYISPKDKILGEWAKMYASTYLDLFIKLFAISFGASLIAAIKPSDSTAIETLLYILGILVFMKVIPTMISKIFGIDIAGGTFKDSLSMLKKGVGVAAGATIGGVAAGVTGVMAFHGTKGQGYTNRTLAGLKSISSVGAGLASGASFGSKGKITGGLGVSNRNLANKAIYDSGLTPTSLLVGSTAGKIGMDYASRIDRENQTKKDRQKSLDDFTKFKGNIEDTAESGKFMKSARQKVSTGELTGITENTLQDWRDSWAEYQYATSDENNKVSLNKLLAGDRAEVIDIKNWKKELDDAIVSKDKNRIELAQQDYNKVLSNYGISSYVADLAMKIDDIEGESGLRFEVEAGKQAGIVDNMVKANMSIKGNSDVRGVTGDITLNSFSDLKDNNTKVKKEVTAIGQEIFESEDDRYRLSKAAHDATGGKK